uniref:Histidine phosphatase superfamily (Branch 1) n=1 Tax=uncultured Thiotrichaceae bacterium TaxID=298394 RepID=A0A6S6UJ71_9GAMM|nr:MAG: Histidine phosphatase superfamily (Branch 1) [uncultured Thiotrichaceae bacterium]
MLMKKSVMAIGLLFCTLLVQSVTVAKADATTEEALWEVLRAKTHFAMIRHALAPGTGDPANFVLDRRETQRNLSEQGKEQAQRIGELFRENGIEAAAVYSSQWYRCSETAELLDLGEVSPLADLNSFFRNNERRDPQTTALTNWLSQLEMDKPLVLVTHQVNITALTGFYPSSGEIVVVERDPEAGMKVLGSIETE